MCRLSLLAAALIGTFASTTTVKAITLDDPLHGACPDCTEQTVGGDPVTVVGPDGVTGFGFTSSLQEHKT